MAQKVKVAQGILPKRYSTSVVVSVIYRLEWSCDLIAPLSAACGTLNPQTPVVAPHIRPE